LRKHPLYITGRHDSMWVTHVRTIDRSSSSIPVPDLSPTKTVEHTIARSLTQTRHVLFTRNTHVVLLYSIENTHSFALLILCKMYIYPLILSFQFQRLLMTFCNEHVWEQF
jgi:hypothetical protein